jgi:hypothetical protein
MISTYLTDLQMGKISKLTLENGNGMNAYITHDGFRWIVKLDESSARSSAFESIKALCCVLSRDNIIYKVG